MRYSVVREDNSYVIVIEGQGILKLSSRHTAVKLLSETFGVNLDPDIDGADDTSAESTRRLALVPLNR